MIKSIIFDWSGVVSNDLDMVFKITNQVLEELGNEKLEIGDFRENFDLPYTDFYKSIGVKLNKDELDKLYIKFFNENKKKPKPFPFAREMFKWLKKKGVTLSILSSHPQHFLDMEIKDYDLKKYFNFIVGGAHDKRDCINGLLEKIGKNKEETIFVGDMTHDIIAGKQAGLMTAAVLSGYHLKNKLEGADPRFILNDIRDLKYILKGYYS